MSELIDKGDEIIIELPKLFCKRCGHEWHPRATNPPKVCPKCKSLYWDKERTRRE